MMNWLDIGIISLVVGSVVHLLSYLKVKDLLNDLLETGESAMTEEARTKWTTQFGRLGLLPLVGLFILFVGLFLSSVGAILAQKPLLFVAIIVYFSICFKFMRPNLKRLELKLNAIQAQA